MRSLGLRACGSPGNIWQKELESLNKQERKEKQSKEDRVLNRVLLWFGGAVILEFLVLILNRFYVNFDASGTELAYGIAQFLRALIWVSLVGAVGCAAWALVKKRKGGKLFWPVLLGTVCLVLMLCSLVAVVWKDIGVQFLCLGVPVAAVLALIYYLYQREFFLLALLGGVGLFALWSYRKLLMEHPRMTYCIFAMAGLVTVAFAVAAFLLQRGKGRLPGKRGLRVLPAKANYALLYVGCAVNACTLIAALALGLTAAYVALFAVVAWLFAAAIYYTVRLM